MANTSPFAGRTVFIAGGSSGINLGIGEHFGKLGARVALISRSIDRVEKAAAGINDAGGDAIGLEADVRDFAAVDRALNEVRERFSEIDVVVSGAAGNFLAPAAGMSGNAFKTVVDIDLIGTFNVFRASFPYIRKPGASLIAITAPQGARPEMFQAHACAAKAGVNMLTKCLAMEWGPAGVRVNAISPGPIDGTEGMARLAATPEMEASLRSKLALRRYGTKQEIAECVEFLVSDHARYITGTIVDCDGGTILGDASADALATSEGV
tara:strand:- start:2864 stop:3664 length:801 start_codon:yes stop_codon:yes gene_type:complete